MRTEIRTTVNMKVEHFDKIIEESDASNNSLSEIINRLLIQVIKQYDGEVKCFEPVLYQKGGKETAWKRVHVTFKHDIYEKCHSMRLFSKFSVSLILAKAIDQYLNTFIGRTNIFMDNYPAVYGVVSHFRYEDYSFTIYWQMPGKKRKQIRQKQQDRFP